MTEQIGEHRLSIWLWAFLSQIETDSGDLEKGDVLSERAVKEAQSLGQVVLQVAANVARVHWLVAKGEWETALGLVEQSKALYLPTDNRMAILYNGLQILAVYTGSGKEADAIDYAESYLKLTREAGAQNYEGIALRHLGQAFLQSGRLAEANRTLDEAIFKLEHLNNRLELGRALYQRANLYRELNQVALLMRDLEQAQSIFQECGAGLDLKKAIEFSSLLA